MASINQWRPALYDTKVGIVTDLGKGVYELLEPKQGERILDIGCGTGHITHEIAKVGSVVVGLDSSDTMIKQAKRDYPEITFVVSDAGNYRTKEAFDAVFSNAALHWMPHAKQVVASMHRALRTGGRLVVEFGGKGNIEQVLWGIESVLKEHDLDIATRNPWYFPTIGEYALLLEKYGFQVQLAQHFDRPTKLPDGEMGLDYWLDNFADDFFSDFSHRQKQAVYKKMKNKLKQYLFKDNAWELDYKRLRIVAVKQ